MASYLGSAVKGAGAGALSGSFVGPVGGIVGGGLGLIAGLFDALDAENDREAKQEILEEISSKFNLQQDEIESLMHQYYSDPDSFLGSKEDVDAYHKAVKNYNPGDYIYGYDSSTGQFDEDKYDFSKSWNKSVDDFVNPYYDKIIKDTSDQVQHSAAGAGIGRGTGAANAIAKAVAQKNDELYKTALQEYNTDRAQSYTEWAGNLDRMQSRLNELKAATDSQLNLQGGLAKDYMDTRKQYFEDVINAKQSRSQGNLQLGSAGLMI